MNEFLNSYFKNIFLTVLIWLCLCAGQSYSVQHNYLPIKTNNILFINQNTGRESSQIVVIYQKSHACETALGIHHSYYFTDQEDAERYDG